MTSEQDRAENPEPFVKTVETRAERSVDDEQGSSVKRALAFIGEVLLAILVALVITALLRVFVFQIFRVPSGSMEQTLEQRDRIAAVRVADWQRGDIVVFQDQRGWLGEPNITANPVIRGLEKVYLLPDSGENYLVKRVIGLPGDRVQCCSPAGNLMVNGQELQESSYLYQTTPGQTVKPSDIEFDVTVPEGRIFVMGDHRDRSGDSRLHMCEQVPGRPVGYNGFVPSDSVVGPVKSTVLPFNRIRGFSTPDTFAQVPAPAQKAPIDPVLGAGTCR